VVIVHKHRINCLLSPDQSLLCSCKISVAVHDHKQSYTCVRYWYVLYLSIINRRRMHCKVMVVACSFCLFVGYLEISCLPRLYVENTVSYGSLWCFQGFCRVAFAKYASFKSSSVIFWQIVFLAFFVLPHPGPLSVILTSCTVYW
jgi:hypothetical protein